MSFVIFLLVYVVCLGAGSGPLGIGRVTLLLFRQIMTDYYVNIVRNYKKLCAKKYKNR